MPAMRSARPDCYNLVANEFVTEIALRFIVGGVVVSVFAVLGNLFKPKSFAGIFGAAPSVALATLGLTVHKNGASYASCEARSMLLGSVALWCYAWTVARFLSRSQAPALAVTAFCLPVWLGVSFLLWFVLLR